MSDQENQRQADFLLQSLWESHTDLETAYGAFIDAGEAFLAEAERDPNSRRLDSLRQAFEKAKTRCRVYHQTQAKNIAAMRNLLEHWKSPGKEYARFRDEADRLTSQYVQLCNDMAVEIDRILRAVEDFDAASR